MTAGRMEHQRCGGRAVRVERECHSFTLCEFCGVIPAREARPSPSRPPAPPLDLFASPGASSQEPARPLPLNQQSVPDRREDSDRRERSAVPAGGRS